MLVLVLNSIKNPHTQTHLPVVLLHSNICILKFKHVLYNWQNFMMKKIICFFLVCRGTAYSSLIECSSGIVLLVEVLSVRVFSLFFLSLHCFQMLQWHWSEKEAWHFSNFSFFWPSAAKEWKQSASLVWFLFVEGWLANVVILVVSIFIET